MWLHLQDCFLYVYIVSRSSNIAGSPFFCSKNFKQHFSLLCIWDSSTVYALCYNWLLLSLSAWLRSQIVVSSNLLNLKVAFVSFYAIELLFPTSWFTILTLILIPYPLSISFLNSNSFCVFLLKNEVEWKGWFVIHNNAIDVHTSNLNCFPPTEFLNHKLPHYPKAELHYYPKGHNCTTPNL